MKFICFCMVTFLFSLNIFASPSTHELNKFLTENTPYVQECQDNRIYLKSDHLIVTENGIFAVDDEVNIPLSELFCDSCGIYTRTESLQNATATVYPILWCKVCQTWRVPNIRGVCGVCGNSF